MKELKIKISALLIVLVILLSTLLIVLPKNEISANAESDIAVSDMSQANEQAISECKFVQASFDEQIMDKLSNSNEFVGYVESELEKSSQALSTYYIIRKNNMKHCLQMKQTLKD